MEAAAAAAVRRAAGLEGGAGAGGRGEGGGGVEVGFSDDDRKQGRTRAHLPHETLALACRRDDRSKGGGGGGGAGPPKCGGGGHPRRHPPDRFPPFLPPSPPPTHQAARSRPGAWARCGAAWWWCAWRGREKEGRGKKGCGWSRRERASASLSRPPVYFFVESTTKKKRGTHHRPPPPAGPHMPPRPAVGGRDVVPVRAWDGGRVGVSRGQKKKTQHQPRPPPSPPPFSQTHRTSPPPSACATGTIPRCGTWVSR